MGDETLCTMMYIYAHYIIELYSLYIFRFPILSALVVKYIHYNNNNTISIYYTFYKIIYND